MARTGGRGDTSIDGEAALADATGVTLPLVDNPVSAGFPTASDGYDFLEVDLNRHLITNRHATFLARVKGRSMIEAGIAEGDILVIDRSRQWHNGAIVVCALNNEFAVKRIVKRGGRWFLQPANRDMEPIPVGARDELVVWGVVTYIIHRSD